MGSANNINLKNIENLPFLTWNQDVRFFEFSVLAYNPVFLNRYYLRIKNSKALKLGPLKLEISIIYKIKKQFSKKVKIFEIWYL